MRAALIYINLETGSCATEVFSDYNPIGACFEWKREYGKMWPGCMWTILADVEARKSRADLLGTEYEWSDYEYGGL